MGSKRGIVGTAALLSLTELAALTAPALAQPASRGVPAPNAENDENEIVVTGFTARDAQSGLFGKQAILNTPFSITSFNEELMQTQQARTITDVTMNDPSVRNNVTSNSESEQFTIRGFPLFASEVAVEGLYGMLPSRRVPIEAFSRVEVFKGPNALVNGITPFGNIGGVINLVPKRATARRTINATGVFLSDSQFGGNVDLGARFGEDNQFGARANLAHYDGDLTIDDATRRASIASLALDYKAGGLKLTADLLYMKDRLTGQDFNFSVGAEFQLPRAPNNRINFGQPWTLNTNYTRRAIFGASYEILPGTVIAARYGILKFGEEWRYVTGNITNNDGAFLSRYNPFSGGTKTKTGDITLNSSFDTGPLSHKVAVVGTMFSSRQAGNLPFTGLPATFNSNIYDPVRVARPDALFNATAKGLLDDLRLSSRRKLNGIAVADTIGAWDDKALLTLGLRRQSVEIINYNRATGAVLNDYSKRKVTPAVGLLVKPTTNWSVYGSYSKGLTPGPFAPGGTVNQGTVFAPFVSTQYELGSKVDLGKWSASVALFRINQPFGYVNGATNTFVLDGSTVNKGIELNVSGSIVEGLTVLGGVAYFDAQLDGTAGRVNDGNTPVGVPKSQVNLFAEYAPPILPGVAVNGRFIYTAKQFYDPENLRPIPSWHRFDMGASYVVKLSHTNLTLRAVVENVVDSSYWQSTARSFLTRGSPRTFRVSAEAKF